MAVETRAHSAWWYARWMVNGKRVCRRLECRVEGEPGSAAYEASREAAKAEEDVLRGALAHRDAAFHRRMADALEMESREKAKTSSRELSEIGRHWDQMKKGRPVSAMWRKTCHSRLKAFSVSMVAQGARTLEQVTAGMAASHMDRMARKGTAAGTFNSTLDLLRGLYARCAENPFYGIRRMQVQSESRVPFTRAELDRLVEACPKWMRGPVATAACAGLRRGDSCKLTWGCVDLEGGFLREVRVNKTGAVVDVPILPLLRRVLAEADDQRQKDRKTAHVWPEAARMSIRNPNGLNWRMRQALVAAGLPSMADRTGRGMRRVNLRGWHSLKTTFITEALNNGMPEEMLRKIVGNSTLDVVRRHYYQPDKARMAAEMQRALGEFGK